MEPKPKLFTRRDFLKLASLTSVAAALGGCASPPAPPPPTNTPPLPSGADMRTATAPAIATDIPRINLITDPQFLAELDSRGIVNKCLVDAPVAQTLGSEERIALIQPAKEALARNPRFPGAAISCTLDTADKQPVVYFTAVDGKLYVPDATGQLFATVIDDNGILSTPTPEAPEAAASYPTDTSEFILGAGGEEITREDIAALDEFGYTESALLKLEGWWRPKLPDGAKYVYEVIPGKGWRAIPKTAESEEGKNDGKFIIPRYTKGEETGLLESGLMPVRYLYKGQAELQQLGNDFFEGIVVNDPQELVGKGQQQIIKTTTGHFVVGFMNADGSLYAWLDAVHDQWIFTAEGTQAAATATPEPEPTPKPTKPPAPTNESQPPSATPGSSDAAPTATPAAQPTPLEKPVVGCERTERGRKEGYYRVQQLDGSVIERRWLDFHPIGKIGYIGDWPFTTDTREFSFEIFGKIIVGPAGGTVTIDLGSYGQRVVRVDSAIISMGASYKVAGVYGGEVCQHNSTYDRLLEPGDVAFFYIVPVGSVDQANLQPAIDSLMNSGEFIAKWVGIQQ